MPITRREYRTADDRLLFEVDEGRFWSEVAPSVCVRRGVLVDALLEGLDVRRGVAAEAVRPTEAGAEVTFADGTTDGYDLVVGADGVHSVVRPSVTAVDADPVGDDGRELALRDGRRGRASTAGPRGPVGATPS